MEQEKIVKRENNIIIRQEEMAGKGTIFSQNNKVWVSGIVEEELEYSHEVLWEKFYRTKVKVQRLSGTEDHIPIIISNLLWGEMSNDSIKGKYIEVGGQFRSYNKEGDDGRKHLDLFLFATVFNLYDNEEDIEDATNANLIYLEGYLCKPPIFRTTPMGKEITDLIIAVNRNYGRSDYIPCIAWGRIARYAKELTVGNRIKLYGRVQSREYFKKFSQESEAGEMREVYEISIMRLVKMEDLRLEG